MYGGQGNYDFGQVILSMSAGYDAPRELYICIPKKYCVDLWYSQFLCHKLEYQTSPTWNLC